MSSKRRPERLEKSLSKEYVYKRQTLQDLAIKYNNSIQWDHYKIKEYPVQTCHFHQNRIIQRYITINSKLEVLDYLYLD